MRERLSKEEGFTLIELMVVVLIIAVLVAIAIPSFLGFRNQAQDRAAQTDLRNALLAEKAVWTATSAFSSTAADLKVYEPTVELGTSLSEDTVLAEFDEDTASQVCLSQQSASGATFMIYDNESASGGTFYAAAGADVTITCPSAASPTLPPTQANVAWSSTEFPEVPTARRTPTRIESPTPDSKTKTKTKTKLGS
jgi:type IV pilus assembly protein PilA